MKEVILHLIERPSSSLIELEVDKLSHLALEQGTFLQFVRHCWKMIAQIRSTTLVKRNLLRMNN